MLDVKELMENVCISNEGKDVANAGYNCLGDAISEIAEGACGIYYNELNSFLLDHISEVEDKMKETQSFDIHGAVRELQYEELYNDLCNEADEIKLYYAYDYLYNHVGITEVTEEQNEDIEFIARYQDDFDDIESELDSIFTLDTLDEDDEESEEE